MSGIRKEVHAQREIWIVDFSDCKENRMIDLSIEFRTLLITNNKPQLILSIFNNRSYATPKFMQAFRTVKREEAIALIEKQAVVGLSDTKKLILKGYNFIFNRNIPSFDSTHAAIDYLLQ